jgi:pyruvate formate lyase activating enzyme
MTKEGMILHLQRLSTEDGPGIRTTVFFKGCPLRCAWCHNPESLSLEPQLQWLENRCIDCRTCLEACLSGCLSKDLDGRLMIDRQRCDGCGICARECPANAAELLGRCTTADELLPELLKDRAYYTKSGGGVTLSGGEPTFQVTFAEQLLEVLKTASIHTALDTCGLCAPHTLERLWPLVDLFLFDLKLYDPALHLHYTGQDNALILENLRWLAGQVHEHPGEKELWVRTPLIPGATYSYENITNLGAFVSRLDGAVQRWELCAFNNLGRDKYRRLDLDWPYKETPLLQQTDLDQAGAWARLSGVDPQIVFVTGAALIEQAARVEL